MLSLEQLQKLNQYLSTIGTYPILLAEEEVLRLDQKQKELDDCDLLQICSTVLNSRLQQNPDLWFNSTVWQQLIKDCKQIDPKPVIQKHHQTGFMIGL